MRADPPDLARWGLHCYCPEALSTPHAVVAEGSNGRLLHATRGGGASRAALRARGLDPTEAAVARLREFDLLAVEGGLLRTTFPVLGSAETTPLRARLRSVGASLAAGIAAPVAGLCAALADLGLADSAYAIVFGHALDGLLWDRLARAGRTPDTALCATRPWWNGVFWAVYPPRPAAAGTNFTRTDDGTLVRVWTATTADAPALRRPVIPVVGDGGELDRLAGSVADQVAEALTGPAIAALPIDDARVATVVVAHELIWDITDALIDAGAISTPEDPAALTFLNRG
ncbi:hypothetical protein DFJ67_5324 [Asanoa ferruginea]|uniref:Uncharacterized protein n=1 Tax=Asanoa ferruginea TaxID=53367 RepID=A0A3D9ZZL2_9ACTN|nr:hypothetical protein [Asanoa ferruginea]REF99290.1 hypothetical protein DFJ67_5324 [Asanoa ferruginea]GIF45889.1 hypothetical protein Afe04nite_04280 [Asanoa ferruginea]